jgi:hypothetical protein
VDLHAVDEARLQTPALAASWNRAPIPWGAWAALRQTSLFEQVAVFYPTTYERLDAPGEMAAVLYVPSSFLPMLGVHPETGGHFLPADDAGETRERPMSQEAVPPRRQEKSAIISHEVWQSQMNGAADIVGRPIRLSLGSTRSLAYYRLGSDSSSTSPTSCCPSVRSSTFRSSRT